MVANPNKCRKRQLHIHSWRFQRSFPNTGYYFLVFPHLSSKRKTSEGLLEPGDRRGVEDIVTSSPQQGGWLHRWVERKAECPFTPYSSVLQWQCRTCLPGPEKSLFRLRIWPGKAINRPCPGSEDARGVPALLTAGGWWRSGSWVLAGRCCGPRTRPTPFQFL